MTLPPNENSQDKGVLSDPDEVKRHAFYIGMALQSEDAAGRRQALADGLLRFGMRFIYGLDALAEHVGHEGPFEELRDETGTLLVLWISGESLTDQADEDERRAQLAEYLLKSGQEGLERYAARCLLALPEGHPQRDTVLARTTLLRLLERSRERGEVDAQIVAINDLLFFMLEPHDRTLELIREGRALLGRGSDPEYQLKLRRNALGFYARLAEAAREEGRTEDHHVWAGQMHELVEEMRTAEPDFFKTAAGLDLVAIVMQISDRPAEAVTLLASAVDASKPGDEVYGSAAMNESRYRLMQGEYERVIKILTPIVPVFEEQYLTAVEEHPGVQVRVSHRRPSVAEAGESFSEVTRTLAFAHAHLNQWDEAIRSLERGKSMRLRYRAAVRRSPAGKHLLELENKLYALGRGVPVAGGEFDAQQTEDWLGAKVSLKNKVLEAYRTQRPRLSPELLASPAIADIARSLAADEAVVILGVARGVGTLVAVICRGDEEQPSGRFLLKDWPLHRWVPFFTGEEDDGWIYALTASELSPDHRAALLHLLNPVDEIIGQPLQPLLRERKVRRVTVIPHHWFHFVPFWALPSMENYSVVIAASTAHFMQSRDASSPAGRRALVVADPTGDLPASLAEAEAVTRHLARHAFDVTRLDREQATENAVVAALSGVSVFHFCGHGRSDVHNPDRSALLVSPQLSEMPTTGDPFHHYAATAQAWQAEADTSRSAVIPGFGRLYEELDEEGQPLERRIEYGERGSLWGRYRNGRLVRLAEMWTAGDILVDSPLGDCRLAFLSACEAGSGSLNAEVDEYSGLPAALQLAGAATVVCSLWPVGDVLTALYVDLFYGTLAQAPQPADVGSVVREVGLQLRRMTREQAVAMLNRLKQQTESPDARFDFEAFAGRIGAREEPYPFNHPYDWAAFYATGTSSILFQQGDAS